MIMNIMSVGYEDLENFKEYAKTNRIEIDFEDLVEYVTIKEVKIVKQNEQIVYCEITNNKGDIEKYGHLNE